MPWAWPLPKPIWLPASTSPTLTLSTTTLLHSRGCWRCHSQPVTAISECIGTYSSRIDRRQCGLSLLEHDLDEDVRGLPENAPAERNVRFGVREHAMGAISTGIQQHLSGLIPYSATFFIFTDYLCAAMRISAVSETGVIYVMTHDSIGLGEDGPTHQPIEHLASFRAMPNMLMLRPADGNETSGAYKVSVLNRKRPSTLAPSRQKLPNLPGTSIDNVLLGAYAISDSSNNKPDLILLASGSEPEIAAKAADVIRKEGKTVRVVSFVCWELFEEQSAEYKESLLPSSVNARVSVEAGATFGWERYIGLDGKSVGVDHFGASAPAGILYKEFGITIENVVAKSKEVLA